MGTTGILLIFISAVVVCWGKPDGAPRSACSSLTPSHRGIQAQTKVSPYTVSTVRDGNKVRVTISSPYGEEFEGFVLQARSSRDTSRLVEGTFSSSRVSKTVDCFNGRQNTLTQVNTSLKTEVVSDWTPSSSVHEEIIFRATVAKTYSLFWVKIDSSPVRIQSDGVSSVNISPSERMNRNSMYDGCLVTVSCFGLPSGCISREDCVLLLSYSKVPDGIRFKMEGHVEPQVYLAMGLSTDNQMGDDSVTQCYYDNSRVITGTSYNRGKRNFEAKEFPNSYQSSYSNGLMSCSWISPFLTQANGNTYDLENNVYYALLATGNINDNGMLSYHDSRVASADRINFTAISAVDEAGVATSVKIHGTFMITAWVGFVSVAILLARHFKNTWENSTIGGVKIWFALHRAFMIISLVFVIIAFITIFVHKNGWNYVTTEPHAILGCIATALGLIQPIMAAFRPAPDHTKRVIFNWMHWGVGNLAHIIAVITIFYAASLESSGLNRDRLKNGFYAVMAIFVIVYLIFHFMFQVHTWTSARKKNNDLGMNEMAAGRTSNLAHSLHSKSVNENVFRILLLGIYSILLLVIIVALYALIGVA